MSWVRSEGREHGLESVLLQLLRATRLIDNLLRVVGLERLLTVVLKDVAHLFERALAYLVSALLTLLFGLGARLRMGVLLLLLPVAHLEEVTSLHLAAVTIGLRHLLEGRLAHQVGTHLLLRAVLGGDALPRLLVATHLLVTDEAHDEV